MRFGLLAAAEYTVKVLVASISDSPAIIVNRFISRIASFGRHEALPSGQGQPETACAGEALAAKILIENGYEILERNYRRKIGEIDIVAKDSNVLVFIEVKTRRTARRGTPKDAVTCAKQRKLSLVALTYLKETGQLNTPARFDVVAVSMKDGVPEVEIVRGAFELACT